MANVTRGSTKTITGTTFSVDSDSNITRISIKNTSGTVIFFWDNPIPTSSGPLEPDGIPIAVGTSLTVTITQSGTVLGGIEIDATSGTAELLIQY